ncbi:hypothetical protein BDQ17DRAFT_1306740 [Cyathus striatus]|nr:hypothetical protein BDQ17DRAFT_1306740 [Cyathus striatus]
MTAARLHPHPSLPAPVVHAGFSIPQSKSHVLAGLQDAYWSDEEEDAECPLCLEEMDISDLNFKPCICGYQICRFCWHHIKENLNKRCPACRRIYTDEAVEFKPIATQDHKRLTQQKKQRERERKELEALGRRQLANVRVVQRNVVYVVGIGPRFAKEELIPTLRSNDYFGQYGKISKIILVKRTPSGGGAPVVGLYITYHRREDAARAISSVDGSPSPGGGREVMRASYGTTKYCMAFLRGVQCNDHNCMNLHEWGDEKDCFTKEDLTTLKHTMKATETRTRSIMKKGDEEAALPRAASWAQKGAHTVASTTSNSVNFPAMPGPTISKSARRPGVHRQGRSATATPSTEPRASVASKAIQERKATPFQALSSRPSTPAATQPPPTSPVEKSARLKKEPIQSILPSASPTPSALAESDAGSGSQEPAPSSPIPSVVPESTIQSPVVSIAPAMNPIPAVPPGLSAPPGIPSPSRPPRVATASPQTPLLASQTSYQMSSAARALLDDVKARRESVLPGNASISPFPDLDRTLQTLSGGDGGGFSFTFDPKLADEATVNEALSEFEADLALPFHGSFADAFPALRSGSSLPVSPFTTPSGLPYAANTNRAIYDPLVGRRSPVGLLEKQDSRDNVGYVGSFNPFADANEEVPSETVHHNSYNPLDEERKVSRFGFARGRQGPVATSPHHVPSPLGSNVHASDRHLFHANHSSAQNISPQNQWGPTGRHDYSFAQTLGSAPGTQPFYSQQQLQQQQTRFQPFDSDISEAQLRDFIQASQRAIVNPSGHSTNVFNGSQSFNDPAIMSAAFASRAPEPVFNGLAYGPPPGLPFPQNTTGHMNGNVIQVEEPGSSHVSTSASPAPSLVLSSADFPALTVTSAGTISSSLQSSSTEVNDDNAEAQSKVARKAAKKAAAAEKATERQRLAQEKAVVKAAERSKLAKEREKAVALKVEQEKAASEKLARIKEDQRAARLEAERLEREKTEREDAEEKQKLAQPKKITAKQNAGTKAKGSLALKGNVSSQSDQTSISTSAFPEATTQVPLLSKKPKKSKPVTKPIKVPKDGESVHDEGSTLPSAATSDTPHLPARTDTNSSNSRSQSLDRNTLTTVQELLAEIDSLNPRLDLPSHPFFNLHKLSSGTKMPLEYGPLVHALSALSVGGGSFANNMPTGSIDNAVSSFQQLLETLTQTISDLLRLLPRTTWDDSSSFDGVLRDMLKGDDFLDDGGDEGHGKEDEVAALTQALERRARWMEVQLSKLEELHRDINTAAVRAVLTFNDSGWDRYGFLPRVGNTLRRFDSIGMVDDKGSMRGMTANELEEKFVVANEAAVFAEIQVREAMERFQDVKFSEAA